MADESLLVQHGGWPLQPELCPYDLDLIAYLDTEAFGPVFHMGPGMHHSVGVYVAGRGHQCLSMTVSTEEVQAYTEWAIEHPALASMYQCLFGDVDGISFGLLPLGFDIISLPHLGEMPDPNRTYGRPLDTTLLVFVSRLPVGGRMIFYPRSSAFDRVNPFIKSLCMRNVLKWDIDYKSCRIYRKLSLWEF
jgi:hypothetical protein